MIKFGEQLNIKFSRIFNFSNLSLKVFRSFLIKSPINMKISKYFRIFGVMANKFKIYSIRLKIALMFHKIYNLISTN